MSRKVSELATKRLGSTIKSAASDGIEPLLRSLLAAIDQLSAKVDKLSQK